MHKEPALSVIFTKYLLARGMRIQSDLVDQLFNSSEKHLARILLLMAEFGEQGESNGLIPEITDERLAEMVGSSVSSIRFFMKRFHDLGLIEYNGRIRVHRALLNVVLHDQMPGDNAVKPPIEDIPLN
jgi:CRP-like cAMP-binding protein